MIIDSRSRTGLSRTMSGNKYRPARNTGLISCLILIFLLSASTVPVYGKTTLTVGTWLTPDSWAQYDPQMNAMKEALPHIELDVFRIAAHSDYAAHLTLLAATGDLPDILQVPPEQVAPLVNAGILLDLRPFMNADSGFATTNWLPGMLDAVTYQRIVFGVPAFVNTYAYAYNADILMQRGVHAPAAGSWISWDQIRDIARKTTYDNSGDGVVDIWGYFQGFTFDSVLPLLFQAGGRLYDERMLIRLNTPEMNEAMNWFLELIHVYKVHPPLGASITQFNQGKIASARLGSTQALAIAANKTPVRVTAGGFYRERSEVAYVTSFAMTTSVRNKEAAWEFLKWLTTAKSQWYVAERGRVPIRRDVAIHQLPDAWMRDFLYGFIFSLEHGQSYPYHLYSDVITRTFKEDIKPVFQGSRPAQAALMQMEEKLNALIREQQ